MCTVVQCYKSYLVGKNYDAFIESGMIFTNKRGIKKSALIMPPADPLKWTSQYGSVTLSQNGKEMPVCGINEKGLVMEQATLLETEYISKINGPVAGCLEIIQYLLDTCCNVQEAIEKLQTAFIEPHSWPIHLLLADEKEDLAIIDFLEGEMKVYHNPNKRFITNSSYMQACSFLNTQDLCQGNGYMVNSIDRFKKVNQLVGQKEKINVCDVFKILGQVTRQDTQWQVAYDVKEKCLYVKTTKHLEPITILLQNIDFAKTGQSMQLDFSNTDKKQLEPFNSEDNHELIATFYNNEQIKKIMNISDAAMFIRYIENQAIEYEKQ